MPKTETTSDVASRRRGRPSGKNRIPLSLEERRARNAQYERQRRNETSDAMAQLAEAAGCDIGISNGDLLASVLAQIQRAAKRKPLEDIESLRRCNENLIQQIAELEQRLGWSEVDDDKENLSKYHHHAQAESFSQCNLQKSNLKHEPIKSTEELSEQEALNIKLYSNNRESNLEG